MAITNFTELKDAAANWLNRSDLTSRIPEFIAMAESRMNRDRRLRVIDALTRTTITVSSQFTSLPTDFGKMVNLEYQSSPVTPMEPLTMQQMDAIRAQDVTGDPLYYCIVGNELEVVPVQSSGVTMGVVYYRRIATLTSTVTTNWLLDAAPDIYLYATLLESAPFLHEDERLGVWQGLYDQRCQDYFASSETDAEGAAPLVARGESFF